jgi:hypothetical protein
VTLTRQRPAPLTISRHERNFREFHATNPEVFRRLVSLTFELKHRGHQKVGIGMLFEVLRWQHMMETVDRHSDFKLNNNYRAYYARLIMENYPTLDGIFEIRELRS